MESVFSITELACLLLDELSLIVYNENLKYPRPIASWNNIRQSSRQLCNYINKASRFYLARNIHIPAELLPVTNAHKIYADYLDCQNNIYLGSWCSRMENDEYDSMKWGYILTFAVKNNLNILVDRQLQNMPPYPLMAIDADTLVFVYNMVEGNNTNIVYSIIDNEHTLYHYTSTEFYIQLRQMDKINYILTNINLIGYLESFTITSPYGDKSLIKYVDNFPLLAKLYMVANDNTNLKLLLNHIIPDNRNIPWYNAQSPDNLIWGICAADCVLLVQFAIELNNPTIIACIINWINRHINYLIEPLFIC